MSHKIPPSTAWLQIVAMACNMEWYNEKGVLHVKFPLEIPFVDPNHGEAMITHAMAVKPW